MKEDKNKINKETEEELSDTPVTESEGQTTDESNEGTPSTEEEAQKEDTGKDPLEEAEAKIAELNDALLRKIAEFENYRKRTVKEKTELILNGGEKTITKILPVIDDMERAI